MMNYKQLKNKLKLQTEMRTHYEELFDIAVLKIENETENKSILYDTLKDVEDLLDKNIDKSTIKWFIKNNIEKTFINNIIFIQENGHTKQS